MMKKERVERIEFTTLISKVLLMKKELDNVVYVFKDGAYIGEIQQKDLAPEGDLLNIAKRKIKQDTSYLYRLQYSA